MARVIMIQGTASSAGKSIIAAALCRIFRQDGRRVAPFKSQNMALNSYATLDGGEMGRAQALQAAACGIEPTVLMNPVLLKPSADAVAQVVVMGKPGAVMNAREYHEHKPLLKPVVRDAYEALARDYDLVVIEGAGSPAEINLRDNDIVNMGMAEIADAPVLLVADIDRGGVFAAIVGTLALLRPGERDRVRGVIINKFRGDPTILQPGIDEIVALTGVPVLGVVPWMDLALEDEDSLTERLGGRRGTGEVTVAVVRLPRLSNATDFDVFLQFPDVTLRFAAAPGDLDDADIIIVPGSKNTRGDLAFLRERALDRAIKDGAARGAVVAGICGGYQMLGRCIDDPHGVEGESGASEGLCLLDVNTELARDKVTVRAAGILSAGGYFASLTGAALAGYEIHMGRTVGPDAAAAPFARTDRGDDGAVSGRVFGTYMHGVFDAMDFTRGLLNEVRRGKGLAPLGGAGGSYDAVREREFDRLAEVVRRSLDVPRIDAIIEEWCHAPR